MRHLVSVLWVDAGSISDSKKKRAEQAQLPLKITYGWLLSYTEEIVKIVTEETLPDDDVWEREYELVLIPTPCVKEIKYLAKLKD